MSEKFPQEKTMVPNAGELTLRDERPEDEAFLFEVYASTREEELALTGWDAPTRAAFLQMQFKAMRRGYAEQFPKGQFSILLKEGFPIGRMVIDRADDAICLVDLALLPGYRGQGFGTFLMQGLVAEAAKMAKPITLHVFKGTRPVHWYERLGFIRVAEDGAYDRFEWQPGR